MTAPDQLSATSPTPYYNGRILTMDDAGTMANTMVVAGSRIAAVGTDSEHLRLGDLGVAAVDLNRSYVLPGFIDAHCHFSIGVFQRLWEDVSDGNLRKLRSDTNREGWIRARQPPHWYKAPNLDELDAIVPDRPAIIVEQGYHRCALNSSARKWLSHQMAPPHFFEELLSRPETLGAGTLTNLPESESKPDSSSSAVFETAMGWAENASRDWYQERHFDTLPDLVALRAREFLAAGVTTVCDAAVTPNLEILLKRVAELGKLPLSVVMMPVGPRGLFDPPIDRLFDSPTGSGSGPLRAGPLKLFVDGGRQCLIEDSDGKIRGHAYYDHDSLSDLIEKAVDGGFSVACHAMGNRGLQMALECHRQVSARRPRTPPMRIEHATLVNLDLVKQMADQGIMTVVQPNWVKWLGHRWLEAPHEHLQFLAFRTMIDEGVLLAGSSDSTDGAVVGPLDGVASAVGRLIADGRHLDESQALTPLESLNLYTRNAARVCGLWHDRGSIEVGKRADFVVLDGDLLNAEALVARAVRVKATYVGGLKSYGS